MNTLKPENMHRAKLGWKKINLIPLFGFGSTRNGKGTDAGEESAKLAALYLLVKETK